MTVEHTASREASSARAATIIVDPGIALAPHTPLRRLAATVSARSAQNAAAVLLALYPWMLIAQVQEWFRPIAALAVVLIAVGTAWRIGRGGAQRRAREQVWRAALVGVGGVLYFRLVLVIVQPFGVQPVWVVWVMALGAHALWMCRQPAHGRWVPLATLGGLLGFALIQFLLVWQNIVGGMVLRDYFNYMTLISLAARDFALVPPNLIPLLRIPYLQYAFDPLVPVLDRVIPLTSSPFALLAFQTLAMLAPALVLWVICLRSAALRPVQFFLPMVYLLLPAVAGVIQTDYHTSAIGTSLLLLGTYLFFVRTSGAWLPLLIGTLTKVSYWPSFFMFSVACLLYRRWRAAALYAAGFIVAMFVYQRLQTVPSYSLAQFYGYLGTSPLEILRNALVHPDLVVDGANLTDPGKWLFPVRLLLPLGFAPLLFAPALLPTLPLVALSVLDSTTWRTLMTAEYTLEYMPFLFAAALLALKAASPSRRQLLVALATVGSMASFVLYPELTTYWSPPLLSRVAQSTAEYLPEVRFADCAMGDDRVLATRYNWATFIRHDFEHVWFDEGSLDQQPSPAVWQQFGLLVFPAAPDDGANVLNFSLTKQNVAGYDVGAYAELRRRLPVLVELPDYDYQGGERLASCAEQFGYTAIRFG